MHVHNNNVHAGTLMSIGVHACAYEVLCVSEEIIYFLEIDFPFSLPSDKSLPQC